jgi:hypothetical protein
VLSKIKSCFSERCEGVGGTAGFRDGWRIWWLQLLLLPVFSRFWTIAAEKRWTGGGILAGMDNEEHRFLQKRKFKLLGRWATTPEALGCRWRHTDPGRFRSLIFHAFDDLLLAAREGGGGDPLSHRSPLLIRFNLCGETAEETLDILLRAGNRVLLQFVGEEAFMRRFGEPRRRPVEESLRFALAHMQEREHQIVLGGGLPIPFQCCSFCGKELESDENPASHSHS